jgi:Icc-related predicted phosphoesterase
MNPNVRRRDILKLLGVGGVVFASGVGLAGCAESVPALVVPQSGGPLPLPPALQDFFFLQLSDTHWGFKGPPNPEAELTLKQTVSAINAVETKPDFIVFTGDLTHTTDDPKERRARLAQFKEIVAELKVKTLHFLPGEHDASPDRGEAFVEAFGPTHYTFDHKGVHFIALDNVSEASGLLGDAQLEWLEKDLAALPREAPIVVLTHRPLFDLYPPWDWATHDGARAIELLAKRPNVTVFYGHIHQENHHMTGAIAHHSARSLVFPLPAPGSVPKKAPLSWDPNSPDHGLGHRAIKLAGGMPQATEVPFRRLT